MPDVNTIAVEAAARAHYAYTWSNVHGDPEESKDRWNHGGVDPEVMDYHRAHVAHQVEAVLSTIPSPLHTWEQGARAAWERSTPEVNGQTHQWRHAGEPINPWEAHP